MMNYFSSRHGKHRAASSASDPTTHSSRYLHSRRQAWNYTENGIVINRALQIRVSSHYCS